MKDYFQWANCPQCGSVLCAVLWRKTKYYPKEVIITRFECKAGHRFKE